jgi:hypothetical protein
MTVFNQEKDYIISLNKTLTTEFDLNELEIELFYDTASKTISQLRDEQSYEPKDTDSIQLPVMLNMQHAYSNSKLKLQALKLITDAVVGFQYPVGSEERLTNYDERDQFAEFYTHSFLGCVERIKPFLKRDIEDEELKKDLLETHSIIKLEAEIDTFCVDVEDILKVINLFMNEFMQNETAVTVIPHVLLEAQSLKDRYLLFGKEGVRVTMTPDQLHINIFEGSYFLLFQSLMKNRSPLLREGYIKVGPNQFLDWFEFNYSEFERPDRLKELIDISPRHREEIYNTQYDIFKSKKQ